MSTLASTAGLSCNCQNNFKPTLKESSTESSMIKDTTHSEPHVQMTRATLTTPSSPSTFNPSITYLLLKEFTWKFLIEMSSDTIICRLMHCSIKPITM